MDEVLPFRETTEHNQQKLLQLIQNAISLGQWELAKSSARIYHKNAPSNCKDLQNLILEVIRHPRKFSHGSETIPTPFHLSWLALLLFMEIYGKDGEKLLPLAARRLLEFKIFLVSLHDDLTEEQQQDCYCMFKLGIIGHKELTHLQASLSLSKEFRSFISEFAIQNLDKCKTLTDFLVSPMKQGEILQERKELIAECYMRVLLSYIGRLKLFESRVQTMLLEECVQIINATKDFYDTGSAIFHNAVTSLVKIIMDTDPGYMKMLYSALIDERSKPVLILVLETAWKLRLERLSLDDVLEVEIADEIGQRIKLAKLLSDSFREMDQTNLMTSYKICNYYKIHLLDCIVNASLDLIAQMKYKFAFELLDPEPFRPLKPLVLLLAWPKCTSYQNAKELLDTLWTDKDYEAEPTFGAACQRLEYNLKISKSCSNIQRDLSSKAERENGDQPEKDMFHEMDFHSMLYVLNKKRLLQCLSSQDVTTILEQQPKTIRFPERVSDEETDLQISEITIYQCFRILEIALRTFVGPYSKINEDHLQNAMNYLRTMIQTIHPLKLRLETLENLFSFVFIQQRHLMSQRKDNRESDITPDYLTTTATQNVPQCKDQGGSNPSDNNSLLSTSDDAQCLDFRDKFLFRESSVKEFLDLLKECIGELIAENFSQRDKKSKDDLQLKENTVSTELDDGIAQLQKNVNDALWRLQLVSGFNHCLQSDEKRSRQSFIEAEESSDSQQSPATRDDSDKMQAIRKEEQLLPQLLSSPESLVHLCLRKGSMVQAQQVIKMFQLEESSCGLKAEFAERFDKCRHDLKQIQPIEPLASTNNQGTKQSALSSIKSAAAAGVLSTSVRSIVNGLLSNERASLMESPRSDSTKGSTQPFQFASIAVCADLVISGELNTTVSKAVLDITDELMKKSTTEEQSQEGSHLAELLNFLKSNIQLFSQIEADAITNEMNDKPSSVSLLLTRSYRKLNGEELGNDFMKLSKQKDCLRDIIGFIDLIDDADSNTVLSEDKSNEPSLCRKSINDTLSAFSTDKLVLIPESMPHRDYIKTLFRHIDTLARLQLFFKTKHSGVQGGMARLEHHTSMGNIKAVNPFIVLNDDISDIFGRLLFEWGMPPKRLESIARQVNLNLVKVVARNFELAIPVKSGHKCPDLTTFVLTQPRNVLNKSEKALEAEDPTELIEDILTKFQKILSGLAPSYETHVASKQIKQLVSSDAFQEFSQSTKRLKYVDLSRLENDSQKLSFMINLHNLMFLHGILVIVSGTIESVPSIDQSDLHKWTYESLMKHPAGRLAVDQYLAYHVGQLGVLSIFDLYRHILLGGTSTAYYGDALRTRQELFEWTTDRLAYAPSEHDRRCIFALTHGSASCPPFKTLKPDTLSTDLDQATKNYLEKYVDVDQKGHKITLPKLLHWHRDLFLERQPLRPCLQTASTLDYKDRDLLRLKFIDKSSTRLAEKLEHTNMEHVTVVYAEHDWKMNLNPFTKMITKGSKRFSQKPGSPKKQRTFVLSEPMKKYLHEASPVAASVISIALEKKQLLNQMDEMIFDSKHAGKKIGTQQIFSLTNFIEKGITNLQQSMENNSTLKEFTKTRSTMILKLLKSLQVDQPMASGTYMQHFQSLIKIVVSMLNICGSIDMESTDFLVELVNVSILHGGVQIPAIIESFPKAFQTLMRDRLLVENVFEIHDQLSDLFDSSLASSEGALNIDLDRIAVLRSELKRCLLLIHDPFAKCSTTLDNVIYFDAEEALDLLEICSEECASSKELVVKLKLEENKIRWYDNFQKLTANQCTGQQTFVTQQIQLTRWQDVIEFTHLHPEYVSILLLACEAFDLVDFWITQFSVPHHLSKICLHAKLYDLLKKTDTDYARLHSELDKIEHKHITLELCQDVLQNPEISTRHSLLLLRFMIENLTAVMPDEEHNVLLNSELGFQALDHFPESLKTSYRHLASKPVLLLEQLIMNMKVELAKIVTDVYRSRVQDEGPLSPILFEIDQVIATYAEKALDIPVIEMVAQEAKAGTIERKKSSKKHVRNNSNTPSQILHGTMDEEGTKEQGNTPKEIAEFLERKISFKVPEEPVNRKNWTSDQSVSSCMVCNVQIFSTFNRRHHCRHCGRVSCSDCSSRRCKVPGQPSKVRVCKDCFNQIYNPERSVSSKEQEPGPDLLGATKDMASSIPLGSTPVNTETETDGHTQEGDVDWQLTTDLLQNEDIREEFCFDQAPSASLCVAIIEQYSDTKKIGGMLSKFANDLSKRLNAKNSLKYHDMDLHMLVGMMEFLLFNAKVKFMKAGDVRGVEICDSYMAHVEVLQLLLNSDWKDIPTMQELSHPEVIRRLRDRLVDSERFSLAIDVTGKCGLDPSTVWFAWGISQLKSGNFPAARDNFSKCLTPLRSVEEKALQQNTLYVTQIVEIIETTPLLSYSLDDVLLSPLHALQEQSRSSGTNCILDRSRYDEIMYYLKKYASHAQIVRFYARQGLLKNAAVYIRDRKCSEEIFIEDLLMRSFHDGSFENLAREMEDIDASLNGWKEYLTKSCRYLSRKGLFNCLYEMQLFMKDFFRAATTCIRFFLGTSGNPARCLRDLYNREYHLDKAKQHLELLMKEKALVKSSFVSHIGSLRVDDPANPPLVQDVSVAELKNHLSTIALQIKVLRFFKEKDKVFNTELKGKVPTLFGNGKERADLVSLLLIESVDNSFPLVSRIIQDYRLPVIAVFGDCVEQLADQREFDKIFSLIKTSESMGMLPEKGRDHLLLQVVKKLIAQGQNARQASPFIKGIKSISKKVEALVICGRLKDAYVEAIKEDRVHDIERILKEAEHTNQKFVADICHKYLTNYKDKLESREKYR